MARNSIMICSWRLGHLVMFSQRCFFRRIRTLSPSSKDGHFLGKSTLMVMNACCPHLIHIHFCLTPLIKTYFLSPPSFPQSFSYWSLYCECLDSFSRVCNAETVIQVFKTLETTTWNTGNSVSKILLKYNKAKVYMN